MVRSPGNSGRGGSSSERGEPAGTRSVSSRGAGRGSSMAEAEIPAAGSRHHRSAYSSVSRCRNTAAASGGGKGRSSRLGTSDAAERSAVPEDSVVKDGSAGGSRGTRADQGVRPTTARGGVAAVWIAGRAGSGGGVGIPPAGPVLSTRRNCSCTSATGQARGVSTGLERAREIKPPSGTVRPSSTE